MSWHEKTALQAVAVDSCVYAVGCLVENVRISITRFVWLAFIQAFLDELVNLVVI